MSLSVPAAIPAAIVVAEAPRSPRFVVGQDPQGRWVAAEINGLAGGLFRTRHDAMHYARDATDHRPDAVVISAGQVDLRI